MSFLSADSRRTDDASGTEHHHHHLICTACGTVTDFTVPDALEADLAATTAEVARATGFRTEHHRLDLLGRCADCG